MAYINPFSYNRDSSVDSKYNYVPDLVGFKPIYGSSVSFSSRLNYLQTVDNALKILPASENNLTVKYNLKFLLSDVDTGNLLKTIEIAGGYRYLKFIDPSNLYKDMIGLVEDYSVIKSSQNLNEVNIVVNSYFKSPIFNWRTSSFFNVDDSHNYSSFKSYSKYDFVYHELVGTYKNKIDSFWFAKENIQAQNNYIFDEAKWTKSFIFESKLPFELKNNFDIYKLDYKNSFIQNIKHKENSNTLKEYTVKFENISNKQALAILLFFEKKCGYRRFIYDFPFLLKNGKVFICKDWIHTFKYFDCNDISATFVEDPNPMINDFYIDGTYGGVTYLKGLKTGFRNGKLYSDLDTNSIAGASSLYFYEPTKLYYYLGIPYNGYSPLITSSDSKYYVDGSLSSGIGIKDGYESYSSIRGKFFKKDGTSLFTTISSNGSLQIFKSNNLEDKIYDGFYFHGCIFEQFILTSSNNPDVKVFFVGDKFLYNLDGTLYTGLFNNLFYRNGVRGNTNSTKNSQGKTDQDIYNLPYLLYSSGYPSLVTGQIPVESKDTTGNLYLWYGKLYNGNFVASGFKKFDTISTNPKYNGNNLLYYNGQLYTGKWTIANGGDDKIYTNGFLYNGFAFTNGTIPDNPATNTYFIQDGEVVPNSNAGARVDKYYYKYGIRILSTGYFNGKYYIDGVGQQ